MRNAFYLARGIVYGVILALAVMGLCWLLVFIDRVF